MSGDERKKIPESLNIPWSTIKSIMKKWMIYGTYKSVYCWPSKKETIWGGHQDTDDSSEGVTNFRSSIRETIRTTTITRSLPVKAL